MTILAELLYIVLWVDWVAIATDASPQSTENATTTSEASDTIVTHSLPPEDDPVNQTSLCC